MILTNLILVDKGEYLPVNLKITGKYLESITPHKKDKELFKSHNCIISFDNAIVFPGLINAHDHLEFNLFPPLKDQTYRHYLEWGYNIHNTFKAEIQKTLEIPLEQRFLWGIFKNFLNGVTTVVHHGSTFPQPLPIQVIDLFKNYIFTHSIELERHWKWKLNNILNNTPLMTHIGEGTNQKAYQEINTLVKWNLVKRSLIGIHGIKMTKKQAYHFDALVWCPVSNLFLYNSLPPIKNLKKATKILFGTDSNLSAKGTIWQHLRTAQETNLLTDQELFESVNSTAAIVLKLQNKGKIEVGYIADIVITKQQSTNPVTSFFTNNTEDILLIIKDGKITYFDSTLYYSIPNSICNHFEKIKIGNSEKYIPKLLAKKFMQLLQVINDKGLVDI